MIPMFECLPRIDLPFLEQYIMQFSIDERRRVKYFFRRLYNDAVESMNCYRNVISSLEKERDLYFSRCSEFEDIIRELTEE